MALTLSEIKPMIASSLGGNVNITITNNGALRGAPTSPSGGLFIARTGNVTGGDVTNIVLEGGGVGWQDALSVNNDTYWFTPAQTNILNQIIGYAKTMSANVQITDMSANN